jgi:hypothetical protein
MRIRVRCKATILCSRVMSLIVDGHHLFCISIFNNLFKKIFFCLFSCKFLLLLGCWTSDVLCTTYILQTVLWHFTVVLITRDTCSPHIFCFIHNGLHHTLSSYISKFLCSSPANQSYHVRTIRRYYGTTDGSMKLGAKRHA